jgi:ATP-dependent DNA helicase PIF1
MSKEDILQSFLKGDNIYISGRAGSGKSVILKEIYNKCKETLSKDSFYITSTTGISAYNIGGRTIHSWAGVILPSYVKNPHQLLKSCVKRILLDFQKKKRWKNTKVLLIDEISMLGASYLELLNAIAKEVRHNNLPFGGIRIVASGDFLQLPPVNDAFCFESDVWSDLNLKNFNLKTEWRFDDPIYANLLKRARVGELSKVDSDLLKSRLVKNFKMDEIFPTILYPRNEDVEKINKDKLDSIPIDAVIYRSLDKVIDKETGTEVNTRIPDEISNEFICETMVKLKVNAQVMLIANLDVTNGLTNGSRGIVKEIKEEGVVVKFINGVEVTISSYTFEIDDDEYKYTRTVIPLKLAYAISIHKSQSLTVDYILVDVGYKIFCPGQAYVALSRCRNLKSLYISSFLQNKIYPDETALEYEMKMLNEDKGEEIEPGM